MRWARGTSSIRRKSRQEEATVGSVEEVVWGSCWVRDIFAGLFLVSCAICWVGVAWWFWRVFALGLVQYGSGEVMWAAGACSGIYVLFAGSGGIEVAISGMCVYAYVFTRCGCQ